MTKVDSDRFGIVSERAVLLEGATLTQNLALPFALDPHRPAIELLMGYAAEQKLIPRAFSAEELFVRS